jgi:hypothetical protein
MKSSSDSSNFLVAIFDRGVVFYVSFGLFANWPGAVLTFVARGQNTI